jgi:predicted PurR-regulated permease PerM
MPAHAFGAHGAMTDDARHDLIRTTLQLVFVAALIAGSFWVLRPFLIPLGWAATIAIALWPVFLRVRGWLGDSRGLSVAAMTVGLLLVLVIPFYLAITTLLDNVDRIAGWSRDLATIVASPPPAWVEEIPLIGERLAAGWRTITAVGPEDLSAQLLPYARTLVGWFAGQVGGVGLIFVELLLTVVIAAILFANGERVADGIDRFARRLAGPRGVDMVHLAAQAVRAVALGVVVTAVVQSCLGGIGLAVAGVPFAAILTAAMFILGVAQIGPMPVLIPALIWTYWAHGVVWGTGLLAWSVVVGVMDNFLRPILIRRGANLPLLLIFAGVIGGLIAFGVIGLFLGPVMLAVGYTLLAAWVDDSGARVRASDRS